MKRRPSKRSAEYADNAAAEAPRREKLQWTAVGGRSLLRQTYSHMEFM
jgi:hypothetical protein